MRKLRMKRGFKPSSPCLQSSLSCLPLQISLLHSKRLNIQHKTLVHCWLFISLCHLLDCEELERSLHLLPDSKGSNMCTVLFCSYYALILRNKELMVQFQIPGPNRAARGHVKSPNKSEMSVSPGSK